MNWVLEHLSYLTHNLFHPVGTINGGSVYLPILSIMDKKTKRWRKQASELQPSEGDPVHTPYESLSVLPHELQILCYQRRYGEAHARHTRLSNARFSMPTCIRMKSMGVCVNAKRTSLCRRCVRFCAV